MKRSLLIFCSLVFIIALITPMLPLEGEGDVYDNTIRLHVLANSDSTEDQELKLKVRDSVLETVSYAVESCRTRLEAENRVRDISDDILISAQNTVYENGYDYGVSMSLDREYYPTREYEGVTMPAGTYLSLRVMIGDAKGQNWWCVLYPPLCTASARPESTLKQAGFTPAQIRVLTEGESPRYKLKFKFLEFFENLLG